MANGWLSKLRQRSWSIGQLLFAIIGLGLVPFVLFAALAAMDAADRQEDEIRRSTLDLSRALAIAIQGELDAAVAAMRVYAESADADSADFHRLRDIAQHILRERPDWANIILADPSRNILFSTAVPFGTRSEVVDRASLDDAIRTRRPVVGQLSTGPRGRPAIPVRVPLLRGGEVVAVLTVTIKPESFVRIFRMQKVPENWVIAVFDANLARVARSRDHAGTIGGSPSPTLREALLRYPAEGVTRTSTLEGDEVVTGFARLPTYGWVVAVGASTLPVRSVLLRGVGFYTAGALITLAACVLLATWLSRLISRDIHRVRELATDMGREQRVAAPGSVITEVDQIGHAMEDTSARLVVLVDQLRDAVDQAQAAGKAKDEFIAVTSHELRNPLSPIVAALHILDMKSDGSTQMERGIMHRQVNQLSRLVDDLLDVSRLTRGQMAITPRRLDFRELAERVVGEARLGLEASRQPVQIGFTAHEDGPLWVLCDEARMTQAINNLLGNAARHANGRPVSVDLAASDSEVRLTVRDFGTGMDDATLGKVFSPFYQSRDNQNELRGSLGLGLSIVRSIVQSHGGRVAARSEGLGQGSAFEVILPRAPAAEVNGS
ncbi:ATP-binding protein [Ramlibacter sp. MMS24-I3-19]|uniref:sensor histidine kinase n=1 Tax=Ramlibacter sp. MMS24-I3-19 TaxID=3416606 RepID=UPI003D05366E